jgi:uncharacterized protein YqgC (DUF456 family)
MPLEEPLNTIVLVLAFLIMLVGLIGTVVPVIPGTLLIFLAALGYAFLDGFHTIGWLALLVLGVLAALATTTDVWASSVGAKIGGASGWSVVAGLLGGLVGFVLFTLPGAILGALLGVLVTEIIRLGELRKALKAGTGWIVGWVLGTLVQLGSGLAMIAIFTWQVL